MHIRNINFTNSAKIAFQGQKENENLKKAADLCNALFPRTLPQNTSSNRINTNDMYIYSNMNLITKALENSAKDFIEAEDIDMGSVIVSKMVPAKIKRILEKGITNPKTPNNTFWKNAINDITNRLNSVKTKLEEHSDYLLKKYAEINNLKIKEEFLKTPNTSPKPDLFVEMKDQGILTASKFVNNIEKETFLKYSSQIDPEINYAGCAKILIEKGNYKAAEEYLLKDTVKLKKELNHTNNDKVKILSNIAKDYEELGDIYSKTNNNNRCDGAYRVAMKIYSSIYSPMNPEFHDNYTNVSKKLCDFYLDKYNEADSEAVKSEYINKLKALRNQMEL